MSDVMLLGVLNMPKELLRSEDEDPLGFMQRHSYYLEAARRIELLIGVIERIHELTKMQSLTVCREIHELCHSAEIEVE